MDTTKPTEGTAPNEQPKKYIRTFAGDMAAVEKGIVPNLAPLEEPKSSPAERLVEASPLVPATEIPPPAAPMETPAFRPDNLPPPHVPVPLQEPEIEMETIHIPPPPPPPLPQPPPKPQPEVIVSPIKAPETPVPLETYAGDFSDKVKETHASTATVLAAEQDAAQKAPEPMPESVRANILYLSLGAVLIIASSVGVYLAYARYQTSIAPIILEPTVFTPIFVDEREQISGSGILLQKAIEQSVNQTLADDAVRLLYTTEATTTENNIFLALAPPAPNILLRNINSSSSMAGIINTSGTPSPFFILSVTSYGETFSGMLSWEKQMPRDLGAFFPAFREPTLSVSTTTVTSVATSTVPMFIPGFRDEVVSDHDTRIYRDGKGRSILLYGYWNQTTLVIARDPASFTEILRRLAISRTSPQ